MLHYYLSLRSEFHVMKSATMSAYKWCLVRLYPKFLVGGLMPYLSCNSSLRSAFRVVLSATTSAWKRFSVRLYLLLFVEGLMSYLCYLCFLAYNGVQHVLIIWVIWRVCYKRQELLTFREHLGSFLVISGVLVAHHFSSLSCVFVRSLSSSCVLCAQWCQCLWIVLS
jgi:hypothetical protein